MNDLDEELDIPHYIVNEYKEYIDSNKSPEKWQNLNALINLAKFNNRFTEEEADLLKKNYK